MKCELCQQANAETVLRRAVAGEEQELFVCQACAREAAARAATPAPAPAPSAPAAAGGAADGGLPPLMGMILDAAFEIVGRAMNLAEPACPVCGITRAEYRKASRLGCPACYEAFAKELEAAIVDLHRSTQHAGKAPGKARQAWRRRQLEQALGEAVKGQRYEEAIALRDQLRRLDAGGEAEPC